MARTTTAQRLQRRTEVWTMRVQEHKTQIQIADELGVNQSTISRDLRWMCDQVVDDLKDLVTQVKVEQYHELLHIVSEAMSQWEASKGTKKVVTRHQTEPIKRHVFDPETGETREVETGDSRVVTIQHVTQLLGNYRYLQAAREAMSDIRDILGANAPLVTVSSVDFVNPPIQITEVVVEIPKSVLLESEEDDDDGITGDSAVG